MPSMGQCQLHSGAEQIRQRYCKELMRNEDITIQLEAKRIFPRPIDLTSSRIKKLFSQGVTWAEIKQKHINYWSARYGLCDYYKHSIKTGKHVGYAYWFIADGLLNLELQALPAINQAKWECKITKPWQGQSNQLVEVLLINMLVPYKLFSNKPANWLAGWRAKLITFPIAEHDWLVWLDELYFSYELAKSASVTSFNKRSINTAIASYKKGKLKGVTTLEELKVYINERILYKTTK